MAEPTRPRWRPTLLPARGWERTALILVLVFTLLRGVAWASTQPGWFAPDEDYHWLYTEYVISQHRLPQLDRPFYAAELTDAVLILNRRQNLAKGPRVTGYTGDPKASIAEIDAEPGFTRKPRGAPPRQVLHPPGYYLGAVVVDRLAGGRSAVTRLTVMRYYSALLGVLAVALAWVLAAQVLARPWERLTVAALVATQPIVAFSSSTLTNDVGVLVTFAAASAWCAWMLRERPAAVQGYGLGAVIAAGALVKATSLSLLPLAMLTLAWLWRRWPQERAAVGGIALRAAGVFAVTALPWYVYLHSVTGSFLGDRSEITRAPPGTHGHGLAHLPVAAYHWLAAVYPAFWFDFLGYEVKQRDLWYYLPLAVGCLGLAGLVAWAAGPARRLWAERSPLPAQAALLVLAVLALLVPFMYIDVLRLQKGLKSIVEQGRFITPAYGGASVLFVLGLRALTRERARWYELALAMAVALSAVNYFHTYARWGLERFYGPLEGHYLRALERAAYDKPEWVTQTFLAVCLGGGAVALAVAFAISLAGARRRA